MCACSTVHEEGKSWATLLPSGTNWQRSSSRKTGWMPPAGLIGMEACPGAHDWACRLSAPGHSVQLMAPKFVASYRTSGRLRAATNITTTAVFGGRTADTPRYGDIASSALEPFVGRHVITRRKQSGASSECQTCRSMPRRGRTAAWQADRSPLRHRKACRIRTVFQSRYRR